MTTANGLSSDLYGDHFATGHPINRERIGVITASGNLTLTKQYRPHLRIDPGGAARSVQLPAESGADGCAFEIYNAGDSAAETLTVQDDTPTTIETLGRGEKCWFHCDGSSWYSMGKSSSVEYGIQIARVALTAAQVKALNATPITMVAAPGAGKFIEFVSATLFLDFASAAYDTIATNDDLEFRYTNGAGQEVASVEATGFLDATADAVAYVPHASPAIASPVLIQPVANAALVLTVSNSEVATGDSPLIVEVLYRVRDASP